MATLLALLALLAVAAEAEAAEAEAAGVDAARPSQRSAALVERRVCPLGVPK